MKVEITKYRAVEVKTEALLGLAGVKSCQGMDFKEIEGKVLGLFPNWKGLEVYVEAPVFDDGLVGVDAISNVCLEVSRLSLDVPVAPKGQLLEDDHVKQIDLDRIDGALLFILSGIGIEAQPHNVTSKTCVIWREDK